MASLAHLLIAYHVIQVTMATKTLYIGGLFDLGDSSQIHSLRRPKWIHTNISNLYGFLDQKIQNICKKCIDT